MTSNYYKLIDKERIVYDPISLFNEIYIGKGDGEKQYFYVNKEKYNYCKFPIILESYEKVNNKHKYVHVLSLVYFFNKKL